MQRGVAQPSIASTGHAWAPQICHNSRQIGEQTDRPGPDSSAADAPVFHSTTRWRFAPRYDVGTGQ